MPMHRVTVLYLIIYLKMIVSNLLYPVFQLDFYGRNVFYIIECGQKRVSNQTQKLQNYFKERKL